MPDLKRMVLKRHGVRERTDVVMKTLEDELKKDPLDTDVLDENLNVLLKMEETLKALDDEIEDQTPLEQFEEETRQALDYQTKIVRIKSRASRRIDSDSHNDGNSSVYGSASSHRVATVKLPKLTMDKFNGDLTKYQDFWNKFEQSVHNNSSITKTDKFNYLLSFLEGNAARAVAGFSLTDKNYDSAIEILKERFGKTDLIIEAHMNSLLNLTPVSRSNDVVGIRSLYVELDVQLRNLDALGVSSDSYGRILCPMVLKSLPNDVALQYSRNKKGKSSWDIKDLLDFLKVEVDSREMAFGSRYDLGSDTVAKEKSGHGQSRNRFNKKEGFPPSTMALFASVSETCPYCETSKHDVDSCTHFSLDARKKMLLKRGRCYLCLGKGHLSRECPEKNCLRCKKCEGFHHPSICPNTKKKISDDKKKIDEKKNNEEKGKSGDVNPKEVVQMAVGTGSLDKTTKTVLLQTATAMMTNLNDGSKMRVRCMLDSGADRTFIREDASRQLNLPVVGKETLTIYRFGAESGEIMTIKRVSFVLTNTQDVSKTIEIEALEIPEISSTTISVPSNEVEEEMKKRGLKMAEGNNFQSTEPVVVLIGSDNYWRVATGSIVRLGAALAAVETILGWTMQGQTTVSSLTVGTRNVTVLKVVTSTVEEDSISKKIQSFWELDAIGISSKESQVSDLNTNETLISFEKSIEKKDGRYEVALPWNGYAQELEDNYQVASNRTKSLLKKLKSDPLLNQEYCAQIKEQLDTGIIERVPKDERCDEEGKIYYMPHRAVVKQDRTTTRVRIVYDASSNKKGVPSLNQCLETGPNLNAELFDVLAKFRNKKVAFTADIEKAFLQISLKPEDRDAVRFLWKNGTNEQDNDDWDVYRMKRVVFGVTSSPFLLAATVKYHLKTQTQSYPETCELIDKHLYVDDLIAGQDDVKGAYTTCVEAKAILADAGMNLRKFKSNSDELLKQLTEKSTSDEAFFLDKSGQEKVLGIIWNPNEDKLLFNDTSLVQFLMNKKNTKRFVLQTVARIYDPLGFLAPFTIQGKVLFQELWVGGVSWDEPIPEPLEVKFENWCRDLVNLKRIKIPRYYFEDESESDEMESKELVCFCDASMKSYATVVYLRYVRKNGQINVSFVASKTRVAPLKTISLARLELMAALLGARLTTYLQEKIFTKEEMRITMSSDSTITLHWIKQSALKWKPFVSNRVGEIQQMTDPETWKHCKGTENPADLPSRGCKLEQLSKTQSWWEGPSWLKLDKKKWPVGKFVDEKTTQNAANEEMRITFKDVFQGTATTKPEKLEPVFDTGRHSRYARTLRIVGWTKRFISNTRKAKEEREINPLTAEELNAAEKTLIHEAQRDEFGDEILSLKAGAKVHPKSRIANLDPFLDDDGLIRVGGRLQKSQLTYREKHPYVLSEKTKLSELLAKQCHLQTFHGGLSSTLTELREKFWIIRARQMTKRCITECLICKKFRAKKGTMKAAPLPTDRTQRAAPFEVTGVDFAGPLYLKISPKKIQKAYITLFTCAVTRAVHLELVSDLTTERFLLAFRRFLGRRGVPKIIYSDNARTFKRANADLDEIWETINSREAKEFYADKRIVWKYSVELGAFWGGFWERIVRAVKTPLKKIVARACLWYEEMETFLIQIEATLNSRPLTFVYNEKDEPSPLTPSHFLVGERITTLPSTTFPREENVPSTQREVTKRWKYRQMLLERFWVRWQKEYLRELRSAHESKATTKDREFKVDDFVLVHDNRTPRHLFKTGRVREVFVGRDGKVRSCEIKLANGSVLKRPIQLLYQLEINDEQ